MRGPFYAGHTAWVVVFVVYMREPGRQGHKVHRQVRIQQGSSASSLCILVECCGSHIGNMCNWGRGLEFCDSAWAEGFKVVNP